MAYGCNNCKHCKCYRGGYWDPDEYECTSDCEDITEEQFERVWSDGETWSILEEPICPGYEECEPEPYDDGPEYDKYADERPSIYDE